MEPFLIVIAICMAAAAWIHIRERFAEMGQEITRLRYRVSDLERRAVTTEPAPMAAALAPEHVQPPTIRQEHPPVEALAPNENAIPEVVREPILENARPIPHPEAPIHLPVRGPAFSDRLRSWFGQEEWEALVGGSLLNKIGALVLVIGLALFLSYSFAHLAPSGRALTCIGVSWSLLGGGVFLERKPTYRMFARGLIGAGWAALYVTAYAIYAVPAARLISNPLVGSLLLLIVALGMIGHSLAYRRQALTAVAYFTAFAALSVTPWSTLAS